MIGKCFAGEAWEIHPINIVRHSLFWLPHEIQILPRPYLSSFFKECWIGEIVSKATLYIQRGWIGVLCSACGVLWWTLDWNKKCCVSSHLVTSFYCHLKTLKNENGSFEGIIKSFYDIREPDLCEKGAAIWFMMSNEIRILDVYSQPVASLPLMYENMFRNSSMSSGEMKM